MQDKIDIVKAAAIIIVDKKILVTRTKGKTFFVAPGGKLEAGESFEDCLVRELKEELNILVDKKDLEFFKKSYSTAIGTDGKNLEMAMYYVNKWVGEIVASSEIEELLWLESGGVKNIQLGSIFTHDVIPYLKDKNLID